MEILQFFADIINGIVGMLNGLLNIIEQLFSPVFNLIERWNNLFGGAESEG